MSLDQDYTELDIVTDSDALVQLGIEYLQAMVPGYVARPGNIETILLEANAHIASEVLIQALGVGPEIFSALGEDLLGVARLEATNATGIATITFIAGASAGTVPAGTLIAVPGTGDEDVLAATDEDVPVIAGGGSSNVAISTVEPGADANGAFGVSTLVDDVADIQQITSGTLAGGTDDETDEDYLNRLTQAMTILAPRPILPKDFATLALQESGVGRATVLDLYYPGTTARDAGQAVGDFANWTPQPPPAPPQTGIARCVTVAITDEAGNPPSSALMNQVWQRLDSQREVNFLTYVMRPGTLTGYTAIDVYADLTAYPGYDLAATQAEAESALAAWLNPLEWGGGTAGASGTWGLDTKVRLNEAIDYLNRPPGVFYVENVRLALAGGAPAAADITLSGAVPMPALGTPHLTIKAAAGV